MKIKTSVKAKGLAAIKLKKVAVSVNMHQNRSLNTGVNFGNIDNKPVQVHTSVKKKGLGTFDFDVDWS